jgi:photosystem II stability/assembly factor-like uncharacterized protein
MTRVWAVVASVVVGGACAGVHHSAGARVDPTEVAQLSFVDERDGFALTKALGLSGPGDREPSLATTSDAGATWYTIAPAPQRVSAVDFTTVKDGWAYGPDRLVTHDGGRTWTPTHPEGSVNALDVIGSSVWSFVGCTYASKPCVDHLERSDDGGRTWRSTLVPRLPAGASQLDRVDAGRAFVWSAFGSGARVPAIVATTDGGNHWRQVTNPCGATLADLSAVDHFDLWVSCSYSGSAAAPQELFRSHDGGVTWTLASRVGIAGKTDVGRLSVRGYGADLLAVSTRVAVLGSARGDLYVTIDGGTTWSRAIAFGEFFGTFTHLRGTTTIWVASANSDNEVGVWHSIDGVHYRRVAVGTPY